MPRLDELRALPIRSYVLYSPLQTYPKQFWGMKTISMDYSLSPSYCWTTYNRSLTLNTLMLFHGKNNPPRYFGGLVGKAIDDKGLVIWMPINAWDDPVPISHELVQLPQYNIALLEPIIYQWIASNTAREMFKCPLTGLTLGTEFHCGSCPYHYQYEYIPNHKGGECVKRKIPFVVNSEKEEIMA